MYHVVGSELLLEAVLRTRTGRIVLSTLCCLATTLLAVLLVPAQVRAFALAADHVPIDARIIDSRQSMSTSLFSSRRCTVRYAFDVLGRTYFKPGAFGQVWSVLPEREFDAAYARGNVKVIYRPANPWNNDLALKVGGLRVWACAWAFGLILAASLSWVWVGRVASAEVRRWIGTAD